MNDLSDQFRTEYLALLKKYNARLIIETGEYDDGTMSSPLFKGRNLNGHLECRPNFTPVNTGRHCMGG